MEWLEKYSLTDHHDVEVLSDPQRTIIDPGGWLWLAKAGEEIIGSAGLMRTKNEQLELVKMTVAPHWRGQGIGKILLDTCLAKARDIGENKLILFSNHQLTTAIQLYEKYGFRHVEVSDSPFETADVKMELVL